MNIKIMKLNKALKEYPGLRQFNLISSGDSFGSSMKSIIDKEPKRHRYITVILALEKESPVGWSWIIHKTRPRYVSPDGVVGIVQASGLSRTRSWSPNRYLLSWVFVKPSERRKKIGSTLFEIAKEISNHRHRTLFVEPWNQSSRNFFKAAGGETRYKAMMAK